MRPPPAHVAAPIAWLEWGDAALARAASADRPIIVLLEARWSRACRELERTLADDRAFAALAHARFVPVRVDVDRRPDVADRLGPAEWPSVAFLTPAGELLGGGAVPSAARLAELAERVDDAWRTRRAEIDAAAHELRAASAPGAPRAPRAPGAPEEPPSVEDIRAVIVAEWDTVHDGFGGAPKRLNADAVRLLLDLALERGDPVLKLLATRALDASGAGLVDPWDGGVYRHAERADWTEPAREKLLAANADALDLFAYAGAVLGEAAYREQARGIAGFVRTWMADPGGGFAASVAMEPAEIDATLLTDANAKMISAMIRAGALLDDAGLTETAIASIERVVLATYRPGDGVGHVCDDPEVRGLLTDQIWLAHALIDAHEATAREPYEMLAEELLHYCVRAMWDDAAGGFMDRAAPAGDQGEKRAAGGVLAERIRPFVVNCAAARALVRVAAASGEPLFAERAPVTLAALGADARAHGLDGAAYALALRSA